MSLISNASAGSFGGVQKARKRLRRLPVWGKKLRKEVDFEWPNEMMVQQMPSDVKIA